MDVKEAVLWLINLVTGISSWLTEKLLDMMVSMGINATQRFAGLLSFLVLSVVLFFGVKNIVKPALKILIAVLIGMLLLSYFNPSW